MNKQDRTRDSLNEAEVTHKSTKLLDISARTQAIMKRTMYAQHVGQVTDSTLKAPDGEYSQVNVRVQYEVMSESARAQDESHEQRDKKEMRENLESEYRRREELSYDRHRSDSGSAPCVSRSVGGEALHFGEGGERAGEARALLGEAALERGRQFDHVVPRVLLVPEAVHHVRTRLERVQHLQARQLRLHLRAPCLSCYSCYLRATRALKH